MDASGEIEVLDVEQLIYEIACDEVPYIGYSPWEMLLVQGKRRRRMEELRCLILGGTR